MVCYVILSLFLHEIPPKISLRNTCLSAWLRPRQVHLRGVNIIDAAIWIPFPNYTHSIDDENHTAPVSDDYETDFGSDDKRDWPDDNFDDKNNGRKYD